MSGLRFGETRTRVAESHALIAPDGRVPSHLPGVSGAVAYVIISPPMGASLTQLLVVFDEDGHAEFEGTDVESCVFVMEGECTVRLEDDGEDLIEGGFAFVPAEMAWEIRDPAPGTRLTIFQKYYDEIEDVPGPAPVFGHVDEIDGVPFHGDPDVLFKTLLPDMPSFDMAVNVATYQPGARLPFVETHVMEHGLIMLEGEGVYRLDKEWYPVAAGDAIWMAPYCPQWFVAMGKGPASYLYFKDVNRSPMG